MADMFKYVSPLIGSKGIYTLVAPFSTSPGEILECIAIRTISDYIANNDDPLQTVYLANDLTEDDYDADAAINIEIVTLRNDNGYQYLVPAKYITAYPIQDGVLYRAVTVVCALPPVHVDQDFTMIYKEIQDIIKANLGVKTVISKVETSHIRGISGSEDAQLQAQRDIVKGDSASIYMTVVEQANLIAEQKQKIALLEKYIIDHYPPPGP